MPQTIGVTKKRWRRLSKGAKTNKITVEDQAERIFALADRAIATLAADVVCNEILGRRKEACHADN